MKDIVGKNLELTPIDNCMILEFCVTKRNILSISLVGHGVGQFYDLFFYNIFYLKAKMENAHPNVVSHRIEKGQFPDTGSSDPNPSIRKDFGQDGLIHFDIELDCGYVDIWLENYYFNTYKIG